MTILQEKRKILKSNKLSFRDVRLDDKDFIIDSNNVINQLSNINTKSILDKNFENDFLGKNCKAKCIVVENNGEVAGYFIYSYLYWANRGQGIYLSNVFIKPEHRQKGILKEIVEYLKKIKDIHFITLLVGDDNKIMQNAILHCGAEDVDMKTFYIVV